MIFFNIPGILMLGLSLGIAVGIGSLTGIGEAGQMLMGGIMAVLLDLAYRLGTPEGNWIHPNRGGSLFYLPVWLFGLGWMVIGAGTAFSEAVWWVLGFSCGGLTLAAVLAIVWFAIADSQKKRRTLEQGEHTIGWLVQANTRLFEAGILDDPALVLISPDKSTAEDKEFMLDLADRIMELKGMDPEELDDDDEAFVAELMADEAYIEGRRDKLPKSLTGGRKICVAHIYIYRHDLPNKLLKGRRVPCAIIWDEPQSLICTRPVERDRTPRKPSEEADW
jgi:hypothetical protein